jgi:hypothetical protein
MTAVPYSWGIIRLAARLRHHAHGRRLSSPHEGSCSTGHLLWRRRRSNVAARSVAAGLTGIRERRGRVSRAGSYPRWRRGRQAEEARTPTLKWQFGRHAWGSGFRTRVLSAEDRQLRAQRQRVCELLLAEADVEASVGRSSWRSLSVLGRRCFWIVSWL